MIILNKLEKLEQEAFDAKVKVHKYDLGDDGLKGLYLNGNIALSDKLETTAEKACILSEEMGHHYTSFGNLLNPSSQQSCKQERQARLWAYDQQIGLKGLVNAYEKNCRSRHEIAEYLEVTEAFLEDAIHCYRDKYGTSAIIDNYYITFIPELSVGKIDF